MTLTVRVTANVNVQSGGLPEVLHYRAKGSAKVLPGVLDC